MTAPPLPRLPRDELALSTHGFQSWSPDALLRRVSDVYALRVLDYWPAARGERSPEAYRETLDAAGLSVLTVNAQPSYGRLCTPGEHDEATAEIVRAIDEAGILGARFVQLYTGVPSYAPYATVPEVFARELDAALAAARRAGVTLLLENNLDQRGEDPHARNPSREIHMLEAVLSRVNDEHLGLTFDPGNFLAVGEEPFPLAYEVLRPWIRNVHLKDPRRYRPHLHALSPWAEKPFTDGREGAFLSVPVGQGAVPWDALVRRFLSDGYGGAWTVDPFCSPGTIDRWCQESLAFLDRYLDAVTPEGPPEA